MSDRDRYFYNQAVGPFTEILIGAKSFLRFGHEKEPSELLGSVSVDGFFGLLVFSVAKAC